MNKRKLSLLMALLISATFLTSCSQPAESSDLSSTSAISDAVSEISSDNSEQETSVVDESSAVSETAEAESSVQSQVSDAAESSNASKVSDSSKKSESSRKSAASSNPSSQQSSGNKKTTVTTTSQQPASSSQTTTSKPSSQTGKQTSTQTSPQPQPDVNNNSVGDINLFNNLFNLANRVTVQLDVPKTELDKLQNDYVKYERKHSKSPIYRKATLTVTVNGQSFTMEEVGIRLKGNMSLSPVYDQNGNLNLSHYKLSFNETFDDKDYYGSEAKVWASTDQRKARKNRRFATLKKMDIKWNGCYDDTQIREIYASEMFRENGVLVQNIGLSQLIMNGQNFGLMKIYEPVDEIFLEKRLPESALGGDLYKCGWTMKPCNYVANQVTFGVDDKDTGAKFNFNLKTNEKSSNHASLVNFLNVINSKTDRASIESAVDLDYFANFLAASYFAGDPDDIRNNYNNHYVYFRRDNGKAVFIPYDNDRTLGITYGYNPDRSGMTKQSPYSEKAAGAGHSQANPLIKSAILNRNAFLTDEYDAALKRIADSGRLDVNKFNEMYELARNNYQSIVTPSVYFANQEMDFRFSLDGAFTTDQNSNFSFAIYSEKILETYHKEMG